MRKKERAASFERLRSFGSVTNQRTVAKYLSEGRDTVARERGLRVTTLMGGRLRSHGFPLEVGIENDAPTFNTAHLVGLVFLLRDAIGDQTSMCTGAGQAHCEGLWGLS